MSIHKEENIVQIINGIKLSTFSPKKGETIIVTINPDLYDRDFCSQIHKCVSKYFSNNNVLTKLDGITLESIMEDDLK